MVMQQLPWSKNALLPCKITMSSKKSVSGCSELAFHMEHHLNNHWYRLMRTTLAGWNVHERARIHQTTGGATEGAIRACEILVLHFLRPLFVALRGHSSTVASPAVGNEHHGPCSLGWWGELLSRTLAQRRVGVPVVFYIKKTTILILLQ